MPLPASHPELKRRFDLQRLRANIVIAAAALFVALTTVAMAVYPGGAPYDVVARHYLFLGNYLSDLGATRTYSGRPNAGSRVLFTIALVAVGASLALFGPVWRAWQTRDRGALLGGAATACALLGGCFFVAAAFTPYDRDYNTHTALVRAAFGLVFAFVACLTAIQIRNFAPRTWIGANVIFLIALVAYIWIDVEGPSIYAPDGLRIQVGAQKAIVYLTVANLGAQAWAVRSRRRDRHEYGLGSPLKSAPTRR